MKKIMMIVLSLLLVFTLAGCKEDSEPYEFDVPEAYNVNLQELGYVEYLSLSNPTITINVRDMGQIVIQLFPLVAKNTVDSFIKYIVEESYTDNTFHRVINGFMIQAGLLENSSCKIPGEMTGNDFENPVSHHMGVLSMARVGGDYDSGSSQFFIIHRDTFYLDGEYAAFGGLISGFNILEYVASLNDREVNEITIAPVYIDSITVNLNGYIPGTVTCITEEAE